MLGICHAYRPMCHPALATAHEDVDGAQPLLMRAVRYGPEPLPRPPRAVPQATAMATLLQPSPEVYDCFDDVMIVSHGRIAFFGPREDLLPFFASLSLVPQPGQTAADFAQEVTASPADQIKFRAQTDSNGGGTAAWEGRAWISPRRMKEAWDASPAGQRVLELQAAPPYWHPLQELVLHRWGGVEGAGRGVRGRWVWGGAGGRAAQQGLQCAQVGQVGGWTRKMLVCAWGRASVGSDELCLLCA